MMWGWPNMMGGWFGGIGMFISIILSVAIPILIILIIIRIIVRGGYRHHHHDYWHGENKNNAFDILQERYAKGEITKEQYDNMKKDLGIN
jgi:putative membrane protein